MGYKINNFFLLIILILLQSCSEGRIGNFLESSFKNIEEPKLKEDIKKNLKNKIVINSGKIVEDKNIEKPGIKEDLKNNKIVVNSEAIPEKNANIKEPKIQEDIKKNLKNKTSTKTEKKSKNKKIFSDKDISFKNRIYQPKSYKIIFILKDVDPKDPTEDLRNILRNSDINFEIEKIERYFEPKNKNIKKN
ncbi:hypothetical protein OA324_00810 [Prochlorococcus sp. AH-716-O05]|nr:hypothetical protein [Prochlorococcus sp. AH-716-O05]